MNQTNIFVVVDIDRILPKPSVDNPGTVNNPIVITNKNDCILMYDDKNDMHDGSGDSELITKSKTGDLFIWSLLTKVSTNDSITFARIIADGSNNAYSVFNWCSELEYTSDYPIPHPVISNNGQKCIANVSDELINGRYSYNIIFKLIKDGEKTPFYYVFDPFVETRKESS